MRLSTSQLLAVLALVLALLSAITVMPLWIPIMLLAISMLLGDGLAQRRVG